ncbi:thrombospondin type 3 repeat-containing protein, partial [Marinifaba aquimaris]|uniref:thrombospondin type 3 repeat-containing protein n=1 Tax=Marinifaba aquimaris TaxID=2741323 RepID=UPI001C2D7A1A
PAPRPRPLPPIFGPLPPATDPETETATDTETVTDTLTETETVTETETEVVDTQAPEFVSESIVTRIDATGLKTLVKRSDLPEEFVTDNVDDNIVPTLTTPLGKLPSGKHLITWLAQDEAGNSTSKQNQLIINPIINLGQNLQVKAGSTIKLPVLLSGYAGQYPVNAQLSTSGSLAASNFDLATSVSLNQGVKGSTSLTIADTAIAGNTLTIRLTSANNAVIGKQSALTIEVVADNTLPVVNLRQSTEGDKATGQLTVTASVNDHTPSDSYQYTWFSDDANINDLNDDDNELTYQVDLATLTPGSYNLTFEVTEQDAETVSYQTVIVVTAPIVLVEDIDSDNDGISDKDEGLQDSDNDGILDHLDNQPNPAYLPISDNVSRPLKVKPGLQLSLGKTSIRAKSGLAKDASLSVEELSQFADTSGQQADNSVVEFEPVSEIIDFEVTGLSNAGQVVEIVLPLPDGVTLPADAVYKKYTLATGWQTFAQDSDNQLASAPLDADEQCPDADAAAYTAGLTQGHACIRIAILDGGPNDADGQANGVIVDPGVIAVEVEVTETETETDSVTQSDTSTETDTETATETDTETAIETETAVETQTETEVEVTETEVETETVTVSETETETEAQPVAKSNTKPSTGSSGGGGHTQGVVIIMLLIFAYLRRVTLQYK